MGHFTHCCKLTGIPIKDSAVLIVMKMRENLWDNSEKSLREYGSTYLCSNEGTRLKFNPVWFPIKGQYNEYGGMEGIIEDDNTKLLEQYYGLSIQEIVDIVTSGRKDDGYDDALSVIKIPFQRPEDWLETEDHYTYYQRKTGNPLPENPTEEVRRAHYMEYHKWKDNNPDSDYGNPQYQERYKELVTYSGMWIHGEVYDRISKISKKDDYGKLDLGNEELLKALGFTETGTSSDKRYKRVFEKDGLSVNSDGTWINVPNESIYTLKQFQKFCKKNGVTIDISKYDSMSKVEQMYELLMPLVKLPMSSEELDKVIKSLDEINDKDKIINIIRENIRFRFNREEGLILFYLLNGQYSDSALIKNPITYLYLDAVKDGKLRSNIVDFWQFDKYMFAMGRFYDVVGTSPQDGEEKMVLDVVKISHDILSEYIKERYEDDEEEID